MKFYQDLKKLRLSKYELRKYINKLLFYNRNNIPADEETKKKLADNYLAMALKLATKYQGNEISSMELFNEAYLAIHKALTVFDGRSSLSTFIYHSIRWHLQTYISENTIPIKLPFYERKKYKEGLTHLFVSESHLKNHASADGNPEILIMKEVLFEELYNLLEDTYSEEEIQYLFNKGKVPKKLIKKLRECKEAQRIYEELKSL